MRTRLASCLLLGLWVGALAAAPVTLDFEALPDSTVLSNEYAGLGLTLNSALSLTAGFSLNEFDYPPHSGAVAIGNLLTGTPLELVFDAPSTGLSAWFTYGGALTVSSFAFDGTLLGSVTSLLASNLGSSEFIDFAPGAASRVLIQSSGDYIVDDLTFERSAGNVPEPASFSLVGLALLAAGSVSRRRNSAPADRRIA